MTNQQFKQVFALADSDVDLSNTDDTILFGIGLSDFKQVMATKEQCAKLLRWQALQFNGEWDSVYVDELRKLFRHRVIVLA